MTVKYLFLTILMLCFTVAIYAQKQNVYYLKNNGKFVDTRDSADFIRIVSEPDSGTTFYNIKEYYRNGTLKLIGKTSKVDLPRLEGQCLTFYPSGKRKAITNYKKGDITGDVYDFYHNGRLYRASQYLDNPKTHKPDVIIKINNDSTGKALVVDGNGYYIGYDDDFKYIKEEGNLKDGLKDGDWKGQDVYKETKITLTEKYENGNLIWGQSTKNGELVKYTQREVLPQFRGGATGFGQFLTTHIHYPALARESNIQGKVVIKFVVERDGSLTEMEVLKSVPGGLTAEALRVLKESPNWIPGYRLGRPVRVQFTVPINFSLAR